MKETAECITSGIKRYKVISEGAGIRTDKRGSKQCVEKSDRKRQHKREGEVRE